MLGEMSAQSNREPRRQGALVTTPGHVPHVTERRAHGRMPCGSPSVGMLCRNDLGLWIQLRLEVCEIFSLEMLLR